MNVDPRWLAQRIRKGGGDDGDQITETITQDVRCSSCGYNLKGVRIPGNCPECGKPIGPHARAATTRHGPTDLYALPHPELKRVGLLGWAFCGGLLAMGCGWIMLYIYLVVIYCGGPLSHGVIMAVAGAWVTPAAIVMTLGYWGLLFHWGTGGRGAEGGLGALLPPVPTARRVLDALLAAAWPAAGACHAASAAMGGTNSTWGERLQLAGCGLSVIGAIALGPMLKMLADLAAAAEDDFAFNRLRTAVVGAPVLAIILVLSPFWTPLASEGGGIGALVVSGISIPLLVPQGFFLLGVWSIGRTLRWGARNARQARDRDARFIERSLKQAAHPGTRLVRDE